MAEVLLISRCWRAECFDQFYSVLFHQRVLPI